MLDWLMENWQVLAIVVAYFLGNATGVPTGWKAFGEWAARMLRAQGTLTIPDVKRSDQAGNKALNSFLDVLKGPKASGARVPLKKRIIGKVIESLPLGKLAGSLLGGLFRRKGAK